MALRSQLSKTRKPVRTLLELTVVLFPQAQVASLPCIHCEHQKVVTGGVSLSSWPWVRQPPNGYHKVWFPPPSPYLVRVGHV